MCSTPGPAQPQRLEIGQTNYPCVIASVMADNDYAFTTAAFTDNPLVLRRNNLA